MKTGRKNKYAMTFIEVLLYLGLFSVFFIAMLQLLFFIRDKHETASQNMKLQRNKMFIYEHLNQSFQEASDIDDANSLFNDNNGTLQLINPDGSILNYELESQILKVDRAGVVSSISYPEYQVEQFNLEPVTTDSDVTGIKATITLDNEKIDTEVWEMLFMLN
jgi:hypothetical protein